VKPKTRRESYWRQFGKEYRKYFQQGTGATKQARNFTRKQCNKAMRAAGKVEAAER